MAVYHEVCRRYLSVEEEEQILQQFSGPTWCCDMQVLWSGIPYNTAQRWANEHGMQTLTAAMGHLMVAENPSCLKTKKTRKQWSTYMQGVCAVFARRISKGHKVTVLTPPPPSRFHPSGLTHFQSIEEPVLKEAVETSGAFQINMVHPTVDGAWHSHYRISPIDETHAWVAEFGMLPKSKQSWRNIEGYKSAQPPVVQTGKAKNVRKVKPGKKAQAHTKKVTKAEVKKVVTVEAGNAKQDMKTAKAEADKAKQNMKAMNVVARQVAKAQKKGAKQNKKAIKGVAKQVAKAQAKQAEQNTKAAKTELKQVAKAGV